MLANLFITLLKLITLPWAGGSKFAPGEMCLNNRREHVK